MSKCFWVADAELAGAVIVPAFAARGVSMNRLGLDAAVCLEKARTYVGFW